MWKNILYVLGTAGIFYLAVLYRSKALLTVCFAAILLPFLFLFLLSNLRQKLKCELFFYSYPIVNTGDYLVGLRVENPGKIYLPRVRVKIQVENAANGRKQWVKAEGKVSAEGSTELSGRLKEPEFGMWKAHCRAVHCYEWTNFLHLCAKVQDERQVMVFPAVYEINLKVGMRTRLFLSDGEQYDPHVSGDDPSEVFKLREYRKGDRLNRIHWKLSAKSDNLIVAELSMPVGCNVVIFLDGQPSAMSKKESRAYWEIVHSISQELLAQECAHYLVWRDSQFKELLCRKAVRNVEDLLDFWCEISPVRMEKGASAEEYKSIFPGEAYASWIVLNHNLALSCNGKPVASMKPDTVKEQMMELELLL
jgi:uncharacterized protein (DUF58 family)